MSTAAAAARYACRACRMVLFDDSVIVEHPAAPTSHASTFKHRRKPEPPVPTTTTATPSEGESNPSPQGTATTTTKAEGYASCTSMFLEPNQQWMGDVTAQDGKLVCPKCSARIGSWKWGGLQCSCGVWHTPGFQVPKSRVDLINPK